ncbi:hypothetical protein ST47_g6127 [Ascochyta rabiei]|uniref:CFEM domain-containing protein n=1 Tax=Didymella rabiei TaxID=5454 RepID=A0A163CUU9_DIDRA|nr:hypothetical protein ST47_g6127 [Ascochyta rabiei]
MGVRSLVVLLLWLFAFFSVEVCGSRVDSRESTIANIPACGLRCLFLELPASGCAPTDLACFCSNEPLEYALAACLLVNCTMQDSLETSRVQADLCNLSNDSKTQELILYTSIVYSIAFLSVALRICGKAVSKRLAWDDVMVVAALLLTALPLGFVLDMTKKGFGEHLWNLEDNKLSPILRNLYISWSTYIIILCMIKISLVLFYLEIFKARRFQITAYVFIGFMVANSFAIFCVTILACNPIPSFWNRNIKGKCIDIQAGAYANSASAIIQDIILLILPLAFVKHLQMRRSRKVAVGFMFCIGTFGVIATLMRLPSLSTFQISIDPSWDYVPITIWTELELAAGFLCVSLPSIRILLVRLLPKRVKEFFLNITQSSRSKSNPTPQHAMPVEQRSWRKNSSWFDISIDSTKSSDYSSKGMEPLTLGSGVRGSVMSAFWNRTPSQPSQLWHLRSGSRRLESAMSNYSELNLAVTSPPYQEKRNGEQVELSDVPKSHRYWSGSSNDGNITALPQIGCIPEGSFSETNLTREHRGLSVQRSRHEQGMV